MGFQIFWTLFANICVPAREFKFSVYQIYSRPQDLNCEDCQKARSLYKYYKPPLHHKLGLVK